MTAIIEPGVRALGKRYVRTDERTGRRLWEDDPATVPTVIDNPEYAWCNSTQACMAALPDDFVSDYRDLLDGAAVDAIEPELRAAWARRGYRAEFVSRDEMASAEVDRQVPDETYWAVWDEAADRLEATELASAAELNDELFGYREAAA